MKEMSGNGIFSDNAEDSASEAGSAKPNNRTIIRIYQVYLDNLGYLWLNLRSYAHFLKSMFWFSFVFAVIALKFANISQSFKCKCILGMKILNSRLSFSSVGSSVIFSCDMVIIVD
jgi:hypothetical protein